MEFFLRKVGGDWLPESRIGLKTQLAVLSLDGHVGQEMGFDPRFETKFYRIQTQDCDQTVQTEAFIGRKW